MKTKKEMDVLKEEVKSVNEEMRELTEEELAQVSGGLALGLNIEPVVLEPTAIINKKFYDGE